MFVVDGTEKLGAVLIARYQKGSIGVDRAGGGATEKKKKGKAKYL